MASTAAPSSTTSKSTVVLRLDDILSDLDKLPQTSEPASSSALTSPTEQYTRQPLPESSESVKTSIELSQRLIESSKRVLQDTEALDTVRAGLDRVDRLLDEVEQGVQS